MKRLLATLAVLTLTACMTPYRPPVTVQGSTQFPGVAGLLERTGAVNVIMVHGMCTHDRADAHAAMNQIVAALDANSRPQVEQGAAPLAAERAAVDIVARENNVAGGKVHFRRLIWSGMTAPLKAQLQYDLTGTPNDCAAASPGTCKPRRVKLNANLKDGLLNDCLADALVYQGQSRVAIGLAMVTALNQALAAGAGERRPVVLVSSSLGSKIVFDALTQMLASSEGTAERNAVR